MKNPFKRKYNYFYSYNYKNKDGSTGVGRASVTLDQKIRSIEKLSEIEQKHIEYSNNQGMDFEKVVITNFILLN